MSELLGQQGCKAFRNRAEETPRLCLSRSSRSGCTRNCLRYPLYNEPVTILAKEAWTVAALERAFTEIMRRHEAWRTTFALADGEPDPELFGPAAPVSLASR